MRGTGIDHAQEVHVSQSGQERLTEDELFELLSNRRRRHILHTLINETEQVDIGTLSQEIAAEEDELAFDEVSSSDRKRVYTALQQSHLPKMDNAGVLEFDRDRGTVEATPALEDIEIYMDVVRGREIPWSDYYLGLTGIIAVVLGGATLSVGPFALLPLSAWVAFAIVALAVSALSHRYYARQNRLGIGSSPPASSTELEYEESA
ncbi:uncharacterized protein Nmag_1332 [Natrialba magadii ATCC 43099]|uniref:DUF7344 domain-containing protein n=1 Tax=Natrialba magadii (strain ATCC 43099 / DSM 3394 / CCM 3739 / CIP 104546 / IAM 13178 / JCM 8861 / NBRC 102185 / NCIMB 2190 / MS3) TaxID=547559 RepID=D3SSW5_NATMM|nr:hypothetical protein [Natrialba magadii]ADD04911.1 uncharacterized protein Nmag_1332 [Natrialba magadii ATCC 43099]ELY23960.1 hypothetical protein C500_19180 [Natrialba magadii ATCC 43099]